MSFQDIQPDQTISSWWRREAFVFPLALFLIMRLIMAAAALIVIQTHPVQPPDWMYWNTSGATYTLTLPLDAPLYSLVAPWHRYDTIWYTKNAMFGYVNDPGIVFLPLYPALIRLLAPLSGSYVLASLIVSSLACIAAFQLLYRLILAVFKDRELARRTLILVAAFPTAYYLVAGYSESLFLALVLGVFLSAYHKRWLLVGLLAFGAGLTRLQGIILCLPLGWLAYVRLREVGWRAQIARMPALIGAPLAVGLYLFFLRLHDFGPLDAFYASEWRSSTRLPWEGIMTFLERWTSGRALYYEIDNAFVLLVFVILAVLTLRKLKPAWVVYTWGTLTVLLMRYYELAQLDSMFRYVLQLFPCFIVLAMLVRHRWSLAAYIVIGGVWQILLLSRFVQWIWVA